MPARKNEQRHLGWNAGDSKRDRPARQFVPAIHPRDNHRGTIASRGVRLESPRFGDLRIGRSSIRPIPQSVSATAPKPANSQVRAARCNGLVKTCAKASPASRCPSRRAFLSPRSVNGKSVSPVCWPVRLQAVSPCRAKYTDGRMVEFIERSFASSGAEVRRHFSENSHQSLIPAGHQRGGSG